jgi:hypothetical protein
MLKGGYNMWGILIHICGMVQKFAGSWQIYKHCSAKNMMQGNKQTKQIIMEGHGV